MQYLLSKQFKKSFFKLSNKIKNKTIEKLEIFIIDPMYADLNNHALSGTLSDHRSINITGDIRVIYKIVDKDIVRLIDIGSHSKLYK